MNVAGAQSDQRQDENDAITLRVLTAIEGKKVVSQRVVARELDIALGLANAYLRRCAAKGWIKVSQIPARRYAYYLTPKGFAEKSRLAASYLRNSLAFVRMAKEQCDGVIAECESRAWRRIVFCGAGEITEIAALCAKDHDVTVLGIVDGDHPAGERSGLPLGTSLASFENVEAAIVTDCQAPQATYDRVASQFDHDRILVLPLLLVSRERPSE
jgi:DNA-binding MarR family transcriptional regulator